MTVSAGSIALAMTSCAVPAALERDSDYTHQAAEIAVGSSPADQVAAEVQTSFDLRVKAGCALRTFKVPEGASEQELVSYRRFVTK